MATYSNENKEQNSNNIPKNAGIKVVTTYQNIDNTQYFDSSASTLSESSIAQLKSNGYKFDNDYFNKLNSEGKLEEAYNYAKCFHFRDRQTEVNYQAQLSIFQDNMISAQQYQNELNQHKDKQQISFYNSVFSNGEKDPTNKYNIRFDNLVRKLGSKVNNDGFIDVEATDLELTFAPNKMKRLWYDVDNENNFDVFCNNMNLSKEDLINSGVQVESLNDGGVRIRFSKQNPLCNKILYCIPENGDYGKNFIEGANDANPDRQPRSQNLLWERYDINVGLKGLVRDKNGNYKEVFSSEQNKISPRDNDFNTNEGITFNYLRNIRQSINNAKETTRAFNANFEERTIQTNIIGSSITSDAIEELNQQYETGQIDYNTFAKKKKVIVNDLKGLLQSASYTPMYSNFYDDDGDIRKVDNTDETMRKVDSKQFAEVLNYITQQDSKDLIFQAGYMGDKAGLFVTVNAMEESDSDEKDKSKHTRIKVFLPGFANDMVNEMMAKDPNFVARHKCDKILSSGYSYNLEHGRNISYSQEQKSFIYNDPTNGIRQNISRGEAERLIVTSKSIDDITQNMIQNYMRVSGEITDNLENTILAEATAIVKQALPGQESNFIKDDGTSFKSNELFIIKNGKLIINPEINLKDYNYEAATMISYIFNNVQRNLKYHYNPSIRDSRSINFKTL